MLVFFCINNVMKFSLENTQVYVNTSDLKQILIELKKYKEFYVEESLPNNLIKLNEFQRDD